jgi:hypothetical protein
MIQLLQISVGEASWPFVAFGQVVAYLLYSTLTAAHMSYMTEFAFIDGHVDNKSVVELASRGTMWSFISQVTFAVLVVIVSIGLGLGNIPAARASQAMATVGLLVTTVRAFACGLSTASGTPMPADETSLLRVGFLELSGVWGELRAQYPEARNS